MTPGRFLLILVIVVVVLFGISLALMHRSAGESADPTNGWVNDIKTSLWGSRRFDVEKDFSSNCRQGRQWLLSQSSASCTARLTNSHDRQVKELQLTLAGAGSFALQYEPLKQDNAFVDRGAVSLNVKSFEPGKALKLVLLPHGGTLTLRRLGGAGPAMVKLD